MTIINNQWHTLSLSMNTFKEEQFKIKPIAGLIEHKSYSSTELIPNSSKVSYTRQSENVSKPFNTKITLQQQKIRL